MHRILLVLAALAVIVAAPLSVRAAVLYIEPSGTEFGPGDTFIAAVRLTTEGECVNAGRIVLSYPPDTLKPVDFSRGGSIISLWVSGPDLASANGEIAFEGGIPGGYCGRIQGDPALTNILGRVVFTVIAPGNGEAFISPSPASALFLNDGLGTPVAVTQTGARVRLLAESAGADNAWLAEIEADDIPPSPFAVFVESTAGVFNGNYYVVFSTSDKQSGLSHYEIFERGIWRTIESPYQLKDQTLTEGVTVRAVDKAGNERVGFYDPALVPERQARPNVLFVLAIVGLLGAGAALSLYLDRKRAPKIESQA